MKVIKSAKSGQFVSKAEARTNPDTTFLETVGKSDDKLRSALDEAVDLFRANMQLALEVETKALLDAVKKVR
jgi:hypothetical protein